MILINLLPHREAKRKRRQQAFYAGLAAAAAAGFVLAGLWYGVEQRSISVQNDRNSVLTGEIGRLDTQIKDVASLRSDIDALKARQQAVENLQSDRNAPVVLFNELADLTPEGIYLTNVKQDGSNVAVLGMAQTNERVAEYLRKLAASSWVEHTDLIEIKNANPQQLSGAKAGSLQNVFEFSMKISIKHPKDPSEVKTMAGAATGQKG